MLADVNVLLKLDPQDAFDQWAHRDNPFLSRGWLAAILISLGSLLKENVKEFCALSTQILWVVFPVSS